MSALSTYSMSQPMCSMPPYDWANGGTTNVFSGMVGIVWVPWELMLFYGMGVEFKGKIVELLQGSKMKAGCHYSNWILYR